MNTQIKVLIGALAGGALGYIIGQVIVDHLGGDIYYSPSKIIWDGGKTEMHPDKMEPFAEKDWHKSNQPVVRNYAEFFEKGGRPDLAALASKYNGEWVAPVEENTETPDVELGVPESEKEKDPSIISFNDFTNDDSGYDKVTVHYYSVDDVLTDDTDTPVISDPEIFLGSEALVSFGSLSEDPDIVYVRNQSKKCLYEVIRFNKAYSLPEALEKKIKRPKKSLNREENGE